MSQHSLTRVAASMQRHAARTAVSCSLTNTLARCMSSAAAAVQPAPSAASAAPSPLTPAAARPRIYTSRNRVSFSLPKEKAGAATQSKQKAVLYPLDSALSLVKSLATASFDETVALTVRLNLDPRKPNQSVRGAATLPAGTGKAIRVAVFAKGEKAQEAKAAGADIVGEKDLADAILAGKIEFDRCIATPDMMSFVGRVARILGPRGLMPNPKVGTVTQDVMLAVRSAKMGSVEFKTDKMGVVAVPVGKASFTAEQLAGNVEAFVEKLVDLKPSGASKGAYILSAHVASTQGPGVALDTKAQPFGKANAASSAGGASDSAAAARASGRFGKMHSVNGFDVVRYDLGAHPPKEKIVTSKGKWPQVIAAVREAKKAGDGWKTVLEKIDGINTSPAIVAKKPAAPAVAGAAAAAKAPKEPKEPKQKAEKPAATPAAAEKKQ